MYVRITIEKNSHVVIHLCSKQGDISNLSLLQVGYLTKLEETE